MKILFITGGLTSLRGKSNSYQETLIERVAARGHQVTILCLAEVSPLPWMHWRKRSEKFPTYHLYNSGIYPGIYPQGGVGTRTPERDIEPSAKLRKMMFEMMAEISPDIISIQSLFGLPFALLQEIAQQSIPTIFTALDYFSICPTAHLFPLDQKPCRLLASQLTCQDCCSETLSYPVFWITHHLNQWINRFKPASFSYSFICRFRNGIIRLNRFYNRNRPLNSSYSKRRLHAIQMLRSLTIVHCISQHQADVFLQLAGPLPNLRVVHAHPASTTFISPKVNSLGKNGKLRFITLNVHAPYKGSELLQSVFTTLENEGFLFELHLFGSVPHPIINSPSVHYHGRYQEEDLEKIAAEADFCLVPSLWDETLGFVGQEMMSRGVPLIVSNRAGVSEFVKDQINGLIFDPSQPNSLLNLFRELLQNEGLRKTIQSNAAIPQQQLKTFDQHVDDIEELYKSII